MTGPRLLAAAALAVLLAAPAAAERIASARYTGPTDRYPHGVLGDDIEHAGLEVTSTSGTVRKLSWEVGSVFEDTAPRLADVDGDGAPEVITVESHETRGARVVVWTLDGGSLRLLTATPYIGRRFRWLAVVGAADLDGDGTVEIAYVDRPHLAKTLRVWRFEAPGTLREIAALDGVTNHRIGERDIAGGIRDCGAGPEMIAASADWSRMMAVRLAVGEGMGLTAREIGRDTSRRAFAEAMRCAG